MNRQKTLIVIVFLLLTGATAGLLLHANSNRKLGESGVLTQPLPGTHNLKVILPQNVPGYACEVTTQAEVVVLALPDDTSFGSSVYTAQDGFRTSVNVVLMGTDRSSIHKPQVCLTAQGWQIDDALTRPEKVPMQAPFAYDLPVMRLIGTIQVPINGQPKTIRGVYVYWLADGREITAKNWQLNWWMARDLLETGVLDRFCYISYLSFCEPGQEDQTFERMKKIIAETVPKFQRVPKTKGAVGAE